MHSGSGERTGRFRHEAMMYGGDEGFLSGVSAFVGDGLWADEAVAVAAPARHLDLLRDWLGADARAVEFIDMHVLGANPARIIDRWQRLVDEHVGRGRVFRGVGEPAWPGRRQAEYQECHLHEFLLNRAFSTGVPWRLMCPYDAANLPGFVVDGAIRTHPLCGDGTRGPTPVRPSAKYRQHGGIEAFAAPLSAPPADALDLRYDCPADIAAVRDAVATFASGNGLDDDQVADLRLASSELATNSLRHGKGSGLLTMWREPDAVLVQISDGGHITDPLVGRRVPRPDAIGGRGLYLTHQVCDLVQLRSSPHGTVARLITWT